MNYFKKVLEERYQEKPEGVIIFDFTVAILVAIFLIITAFNCVYTIGEQQQGVLTTLGVPAPITTPGLHFKLPFVQSIQKINTTIQGFGIGYDLENNQSIEAESLMITSDYNFVNLDFFVEFRVSDPVVAFYSSSQPIDILKNIAQSSIRAVISGYAVDDVLTTGKNEIQAAIKASIIEKLEKENIGLQLVNITIQDAEPPTQAVIEAFKAVETAKQGKETALNNANKYLNEKIPAAEASADAIVKDAEAKKTQRINEATAQVARFNATYEEYIKNPDITRQRMFYETMEEVLPTLKIVIDNGAGDLQKFYPVESFTTTQ